MTMICRLGSCISGTTRVWRVDMDDWNGVLLMDVKVNEESHLYSSCIPIW